MIYGIGSDITDIRRFEKGPDYLEKFFQKHFSKTEQQHFYKKHPDQKPTAAYIAKRFSAKESVAKALGTGFRNGIYLNQIEVLSDQLSKPIINLTSTALSYAQKCHIKNIHITISDQYPYAMSVSVAECC